MEPQPLQRTPSKITITNTNPHLKFLKSLYELDAQIIQFTNLPIHTPGIDLLYQDIVKKFGFIRNFLIAETVANNSLPDDLLEIERKLLDLEDELRRSNLHCVDDNDDVDREDEGSEIGSVCESCLNDDYEVEGEDVSEGFSVREGVETQLLGEFSDLTVPSPEKVEEPSPTPEKVEETTSFDCRREKSGKRRRRWWWRTVVVLMPASLVIMAVCYFERKQREGFLTPT